MFIGSCRRGASHQRSCSRHTKRAYVCRGGKVKLLEVLPPKNEMTAARVEAIKSLAMTVDILSIPSHPMGNLRMPNIDCFDQAGLDGKKTIVHYTVRGKSWPTIQAELLKMHEVGIKILLIVRGDEPKFPVQDPECDIDSVAVVEFIKNRLNQGLSFEGKRIGGSTAFEVGCAVNITSKGGDLFQQNRLTQKINAGADFFITHPVFDAKKAVHFLDSHQSSFGKIIKRLYCGLIPFNTIKQVHYFANIPEMDVPRKLIEELQSMAEGDLEHFRRRSVDLTMNIAQALIGKPGVSGFHIVAGSSDLTTASQLLHVMKLKGL